MTAFDSLRPTQCQTEAARTAGTDKLVTSEAIDLISRLLTLDPHRRTSAKQVSADFATLNPMVRYLQTYASFLRLMTPIYTRLLRYALLQAQKCTI